MVITRERENERKKIGKNLSSFWSVKEKRSKTKGDERKKKIPKRRQADNILFLSVKTMNVKAGQNLRRFTNISFMQFSGHCSVHPVIRIEEKEIVFIRWQ